MRLELDTNGYVCCVLYGCSTGSCTEYTGTVPTQPETYTNIDDWANRAQTNAYYLDDDGNLAYDSTKATTAASDKPLQDYTTGERLTGALWIDNKPVYRYVWSGEATITNGQATLVTLPFTPETVISLTGAFYSENQDSWYSTTTTYHGNNNWNVSMFINSANELKFSVGSSFTGTKKVNVIIEYTKFIVVNRFNCNSSQNITGAFLNKNGTQYSATGYAISHPIPVEVGAKYYITANSNFSADYYCCYYNASNAVVTSTTPTATTSGAFYASTAPAGAVYMKISTTTSLMATAMVIKANREPATAYVPYVE